MNLDNIIQNVTVLETLINDVALTNNAKTTQREILFHTTLNDIIAEYMTVKDAANFGDFLTEIFEELNESTEKTSILKVLGVIENSLQHSVIKHDLISYENARDVLTLNVTNKDLKTCINADSDEYNKNLKAIIKTRKFELDSEVLSANDKLTEHLNGKTLDEIETILQVAKIIKSRKIKEEKKQA
ncbi:MAG: hypothetical protein KAR40_16060 [Candidatus Sabulitectum sp.]|nr:hypothetical protein [Candidatus Sabulitectum sp.]